MSSRIWLAALLVLGLFIMGGLLGAGVHWALLRPQEPTPALKSAEKQTNSALPGEPGPSAQALPLAAQASPEPAAPALVGMAKGPLKRACLGLWRKLSPFIARCDKSEKLGLGGSPQPAMLRVAFKAAGGVASALSVAVQSSAAQDRALKSCLAPKLEPLLLDFPAEDGHYTFTSPAAAFDERTP